VFPKGGNFLTSSATISVSRRTFFHIINYLIILLELVKSVILLGVRLTSWLKKTRNEHRILIFENGHLEDRGDGKIILKCVLGKYV